jgi:hypothetical protein
MYGRPPLDRLQALRTAAAVLESRQPAWTAFFRLDGTPCRARWHWPGVVVVCDDNTGETLARSLPGRPAEADAETIARARRMHDAAP